MNHHHLINYFFLLLISLLLFSCSSKNEYRYYPLYGDDKSSLDKYKREAEIIEASNDSIAYMEGYRKYQLSVVFSEIVSNSNLHKMPSGYVLLNENGKDLAKTFTCIGLDGIKQDIEMEIRKAMDQ